MSQVYVVDAGVLFSTWTKKIPDATLVTTSNILSELHNKPSQFRSEILMVINRMRAIDPEEKEIHRTTDAASQSGDISVLSENDIELIALALKIKNEGKKVTLVSTDFAVLNTASHLDIAILDPSGKFKEQITWVRRCPACKYKSKTPSDDIECPVCGTEMRRMSLRKRKMS
ncbi:MAG: NOB1 family endonuclease [Candidatus Thorarchaeota archaeon SMTZ1-45]|nr:MAG: hypothetical protein AM325_04605 [Candidatus Thorarchaeota archaeon SMTZ1-45]